MKHGFFVLVVLCFVFLVDLGLIVAASKMRPLPSATDSKTG